MGIKFCILISLIILAVIIMPVMAEQQSTETINQKTEELIKILQTKIIPPKGTLKSEVDEIFGKPEIKKLTGKGSKIMDPMHIYQLSLVVQPKNKDDFRAYLYITYREGQVYMADINHSCIVKNRDKRIEGHDLSRENRDVLHDLLEIYDKYEEKLRKASWNKNL